tara:strand:- start:2683 stop:2856 length:174 start_codon:yes stop_codon:yes gene_type:complete
MRLGLGLFIRSSVGGGGGGNPVEDMLVAFISRVTTDGGTIDGASCLTTILTGLNDIS